MQGSEVKHGASHSGLFITLLPWWCGECSQCTDHSSFLPSRSKGSMGNKALSHDSVFIFESAPGSVTGDVLSQENIPGRVKTLQVRASSLISSDAFCQLFPRKVCCLIPLLCALGFCWLKRPRPNLLLLDLFCLLEAEFLSSPSAFSLPRSHSVWCESSSWTLGNFPFCVHFNGIYVLYFIATAFGLRPFINTVVCSSHCYSLNIICVTLFGSSGSDVFTIHGSTRGCVSVWDDGYVRMLWQLYLYSFVFDLCQQKILISAGSFPSSKAVLNPPWQLPYELLILLMHFINCPAWSTQIKV